jgi:streptomycin 6-kinase
VTGPLRLSVPESLVASHAYYFGEAGRRWTAALPALAQNRLDRWELTVVGSPRSGAVAWILPVRGPDGAEAVLKLQPVDDETIGEPEALRRWGGRGAVRLLAYDAATGSMLLERLDAQHTLGAEPDDLAAVTTIAQLLAVLTAGRAPASIRRLDEIAHAMLDDLPTVLDRLPAGPDRTLLRTCGDLLGELLDDPVDDRLLHWDLHYDNVLRSFRPEPAARWLAIDPKPLAGDVGFELLPALWNRWDAVVGSGDLAAHVLRRFDLMTEILTLDRSRAAAWTLARVLQDALWDIGSFQQASLKAPHRTVARALLTGRLENRSGRRAPGGARPGVRLRRGQGVI